MYRIIWFIKYYLILVLNHLVQNKLSLINKLPLLFNSGIQRFGLKTRGPFVLRGGGSMLESGYKVLPSIKTSATSFGTEYLNHLLYRSFLLLRSYPYKPNCAVASTSAPPASLPQARMFLDTIVPTYFRSDHAVKHRPIHPDRR